MITIVPDGELFYVKNDNNAVLAELTITNGAFGKCIIFTKLINNISKEQLKEVVLFMDRYDRSKRIQVEK